MEIEDEHFKLKNSLENQKDLVKYVINTFKSSASNEEKESIIEDLKKVIGTLGIPFVLLLNNEDFTQELITFGIENEGEKNTICNFLGICFSAFDFMENWSLVIPNLKFAGDTLNLKFKISKRENAFEFERLFERLFNFDLKSDEIINLVNSENFNGEPDNSLFNVTELNDFVVKLSDFINNDLSNFNEDYTNAINEYISTQKNQLSAKLNDLISVLYNLKDDNDNNLSEETSKKGKKYNNFFI